jgi:glycosyltransferase involved in cell wall biosynthesis
MKRLLLGESSTNGIDVHRFRAYQLWPRTATSVVMPEAITAMMKTHFDVVHAHNYLYFSSIASTIVKKLKNASFVLTGHARVEYTFKRRLLRALYDSLPGRFILKQASSVIALSKNEFEHLVSIGVPADKIKIISHGVDFSLFSGASGEYFRKKYGCLGKIVLFAGRLEEKKGLFTLIQSIAKARKEVGDFTTVIVGEDWGLKNRLLHLAQLLGVNGLLLFTGPLYAEALASAYAASNVFVLPSTSEAFPVVLFEAMAAGKPLIASAVGGIPNIVKERNGILVPKGNSDLLAESIVKLLKDEKLASFYGRENQLEAKLHSWEKVAKQVEHVYELALAK